MQYKVCMSIAGSDPSGGAGIQADLKVFSVWQCYGEAAITALTVQNTQGVIYSSPVSAELVYDQITAVFKDLKPDAVKIGMTPTVEIIQNITKAIKQFKPAFVVLDPVMVSTSGKKLLNSEAIKVLHSELMPLCNLITPNLPEAMTLTGLQSTDQRELAKLLSQSIGGTAVLVKGGHSEGPPTDILYYNHHWYDYNTATRIDTCNSHGTGCVLSSSIAAAVANGATLPEAVSLAKKFLTKALEKGAEYKAGTGRGALFLLP